MIRSMTAFGRARVTTEEKDITVEIKSVNSRYLDCTVRMPRRYSFLEDKVKTYAQQNGISRGKVEIYVGVDTLSDTEVEILLDDVESFAQNVMCQHYIISYGDNTELIENLCDMLGIQIIR